MLNLQVLLTVYRIKGPIFVQFVIAANSADCTFMSRFFSLVAGLRWGVGAGGRSPPVMLCG